MKIYCKLNKGNNHNTGVLHTFVATNSTPTSLVFYRIRNLLLLVYCVYLAFFGFSYFSPITLIGSPIYTMRLGQALLALCLCGGDIMCHRRSSKTILGESYSTYRPLALPSAPCLEKNKGKIAQCLDSKLPPGIEKLTWNHNKATAGMLASSQP